MNYNIKIKINAVRTLLSYTNKKYYFLRDAFAEIQADDNSALQNTINDKKFNTNKNYYKCINELWRELKKDNVHSKIYQQVLNDTKIPTNDKQLLLNTITDIENNKNDILGKTNVDFEASSLSGFISWSFAESILGLKPNFFSGMRRTYGL